jgi:hypothetical protein
MHMAFFVMDVWWLLHVVVLVVDQQGLAVLGELWYDMISVTLGTTLSRSLFGIASCVDV